MEPLRGKEPLVKSQFYSMLNASQQALFMFYAYGILMVVRLLSVSTQSMVRN
jgi:hypothetical protein